MALYVTDTHPLVWYLEGRHQKLSLRALRIFNNAVRGRVLVYIPAVVLWEITFLLRLGRTRLREPFDQWARKLLAQPGFEFAPLDVDVIAEAGGVALHHDPFDAAIVATARIKDAPLITKDHELTEAGLVEVVW